MVLETTGNILICSILTPDVPLYRLDPVCVCVCTSHLSYCFDSIHATWVRLSSLVLDGLSEAVEKRKDAFSTYLQEVADEVKQFRGRTKLLTFLRGSMHKDVAMHGLLLLPFCQVRDVGSTGMCCLSESAVRLHALERSWRRLVSGCMIC